MSCIYDSELGSSTEYVEFHCYSCSIFTCSFVSKFGSKKLAIGGRHKEVAMVLRTNSHGVFKTFLTIDHSIRSDHGYLYELHYVIQVEKLKGSSSDCLIFPECHETEDDNLNKKKNSRSCLSLSPFLIFFGMK